LLQAQPGTIAVDGDHLAGRDARIAARLEARGSSTRRAGVSRHRRAEAGRRDLAGGRTVFARVKPLERLGKTIPHGWPRRGR
jgi:hypothetical protein